MSERVCVIPGAGPGNGLALAKRFAAAGERVAMLARDGKNVRALAEQVEGATGYACDVTDATAIDKTFKSIRKDLGGITTLLYNAGAAVFGNAEQVSPVDFETAWRTNALGLYHCARAALPDLREADAPSLVVTGATASLRGGANFAGFAAAKAAQHSLTQSLARQLGPEGIHVAIAIVDGVVDTPRTRQMLADKPDDFFMSPDAIADSIYHLTRQDPSAWTFELDLRPFGESW